MENKTKTPVIFWIVLYNHSHGCDVWPEFGDVGEDDIIEKMRADGDWDEEEDNDEMTYVEMRGPFSTDDPMYRTPSDK
jgi:hypothetical protein